MTNESELRNRIDELFDTNFEQREGRVAPTFADCCSASNFDPLDSNNVNGLESQSASNTHAE